jgi:hypothetical protein
MNSRGSGWGPLEGFCECGDEPSGSGETELVNYVFYQPRYTHIDQPQIRPELVSSNTTDV